MKSRIFKISALSSAMLLTAGNLYASTLEEIIVTAQKRSESAQTVPIALTALTEKSLASSGVSNHDDLTLVTPGLQYVRAIGSATPFIRGVGTTNTAPGTEASVATYIDGFYIRDMNAASQNFSGVERVEVLKGPQGTLFGRNATGGVIQTITKTPSQDQSATLGLHMASYDVVGGGFYGTTGIGDNIAADLMVAIQRQDGGVGTNLTTGRDVGFEEFTQVRSKWLFSPSDDTDVTLTLSWNEKENDVGMLRSCAQGAICIAGLQGAKNFKDTFDDSMPITESKGKMVGLRIDHSFSNVDFVSLTSYQNYESYDLIDQDAGPLPLIVVELNVETTTVSQEFQLLSTYDSPLQWIVGAFYWNDEPVNEPSFIYGAFVSPSVNFSSHLDTTSYAVFGQVDYSFNEDTTLTAGLRWTKDEKDIYGASTLGPFMGTPGVPDGTILDVPFDDSESWDEITWRLALSHQFNEDVMGYVSYNRGFKSGTYNAFIPAGVVQPALEPEILDTYAVGMKGDFLDGRLRVNGELFYYTSENMQLLRVEGPSTILFNAAEGEARGLELTITALLSDSLTLMVNYAYLDSEYSSFDEDCVLSTPSQDANFGFGGNILTLGSCTGNRLVYAPEHTAGVILNHSLPTSVGVIDSTLTYHYNDGYFASPNQRFNQSAYSVVSANVGWTSNDEKYNVIVYGNNLTEEEYSSYIQSSSLGDLNAINIFPREFGIRFNIHW